MSSGRAGASQSSWWVVVLCCREGGQLSWCVCPCQGSSLMRPCHFHMRWGLQSSGFCVQTGVECLTPLRACKLMFQPTGVSGSVQC